MVSHIKEKADSIVIILSAGDAVNYCFLVSLDLLGAGAFSGTGVPSTFLCTLTFLHTCLPFTSWQTFLTSASARACGMEKATNASIPTQTIKLNDRILFSFRNYGLNFCLNGSSPNGLWKVPTYKCSYCDPK